MTPSVLPPTADASSRKAFAVPEDLLQHALETADVMARELALADTREARAALQHEVSEADERVRRDELTAARGYLAAFNTHPGFRPPLDALIRLYTRRKSVNNLIKLFDALIKAAPTPRDHAEALTLRGELLEDRLMVERGAHEAYTEAVRVDPTYRVAWHDLEREALRSGDREFLVQVLRQLASLTQDPGRKSLLLIELAQELTQRDAPDAVDEASRCLRDATSLPLGRWRSLTELERFAERFDRPVDLVFALEHRAEIAERVAAGGDFDGGSGAFAISRLEGAELASEESANLWARAARIRLSRMDDPEGARGAMARCLTLRSQDPRYRYFAMILADQANDIDQASAHAAWLLAQGFGDRSLRASMHFRVAETAALAGQMAEANHSLRAALEANPESATALGALIEQLAATGDGAMIVHEFDRMAEGSTDERTRAALRRAAGFYALALQRDEAAALQQFRRACETDPADAVSRRAVVTLLSRARVTPELVRERVVAIEDLLSLVADDDEREALLLEKFNAQRYDLADPRGAARTAEQLVEITRESVWSLEASALMWAAAGEMAHAARWAEALGESSELTGGAADAAAWRSVAARLSWAAGDVARAKEIAVTGQREMPEAPYLAAIAQGLCLDARDFAMAWDVTTRHAEALDDRDEGTRWLVLASLRFEHAGAAEFARKALEASVARDPGAPSVRVAVLAATRWRGDADLRARVTEAGMESDACGPEEVALGVEMALVKAFVEHDVPAAAELVEQVALRDGGSSAAVAFLHAIARGATEGPDADTTVSALQEVLSTIASGDPLRVGVELEVARALGASHTTRDQAVAARELVDEDQPNLIAPRLLALLDAIQREGREDVPAALGRVAALGEPEMAGALRSAAMTSLVALGRSPEARALAEAHPTLTTSVIVGTEHPAGLDQAATYAERLAARAALSAGASGRADARASASWASVGGHDADALARAEALLTQDPTDLVALDVKRVSGRRVKHYQAVVDACSALAQRVASPTRAAAYWEEAGVVAAEELRQPALAERCLRSALEADPTREISYKKLREILDGRKDTGAMEALVSRRVSVVRTPQEKAELYWEQARLRRALGLREEALESAMRVVDLSPSHVAAFALIAEVHAASGRLAETAAALAAMAGCDETPPAQRRAARLGAVDVYDRRLGRAEEALAQIDALFLEGDADDALIERAVLLAERASRWQDALKFARRAVERARGEQARAAAMLRVAHLYRDRVQDVHGAREYALQAHAAFPTDLSVLRTLQGLSDPDQRARHARRTADALREGARSGEITQSLALALAETARSGGDGVLERAALRMAAVLGADVTTTALGEPSGATLRDPALMLRYRHPADAGRAVTLLETLMPDLCELTGLSTDAMKVGRSDRIKGQHPTRAALAPYLALVGQREFDLYVGGTDNARIAVIPGDPMTVVLGRAVALPLAPDARFELVRRLLLAARALGPLAVLPAESAAAHALAALVYAELPLTVGTDKIEALLRPVAKAVSRKVRRSLAESGRALAAAPDVWSEFARAARGATATARRGALAVTGAVGAAFADLARDEGMAGQQLPVLLSRSTAARELAQFALSDALAQLARECGVDRR